MLPEMRPPIIDGMLRRGETANIIAAAKIGKSFLALLLAWCVALGRHWLSHSVTQGRALIIDNELHPETLANRIYRIGDYLHVEPDSEPYQNIDVICLRGVGCDIHALDSRLAAIEPGYYSLVIVDALYRTLPSGTSKTITQQ